MKPVRLKRLFTYLLLLLVFAAAAAYFYHPELFDAGTGEPPGDNIVTSDSVEPDVQAVPLPEGFPDVAGDGTYFTASYTYAGDAYIILDGNVPDFTDSEKTGANDTVFEMYSDLDSLGRCGVAYANICQELMPTEKRESISSVTPSGWVNHKYDTGIVDGGYVYNRCHLIGFQLAGENANPRNLITGTRYLNIEGMLPFENLVADYVHETDNHVLYRVTPMYTGDNLVADGVQMEGWSVEDGGDGVCFNVYAFNVQPGIDIDYATGENWLHE